MSSSEVPFDVAKLLKQDLGDEQAVIELQERYHGATTREEWNRILAVLGELRKMKADSEPVEAAACGKLGCRSDEQLAKIDGRVLCADCRATYALNER